MINFANIHTVVTDFEGTIVSIASVKDVLFPYAVAQIKNGYVQQHEAEIGDILQAIRDEVKNPDLSVDGCAEQLLAWIAADQKIGPLKKLQGQIWHDGYVNGELKGQLFDDVDRQFQAWHHAGIQIVGYSSGSVQAQQDLVTYSNFGDCSGFFATYFDTAVGGKKDVASYTKIAQELKVAPNQILFLSDTPDELAAAMKAGFNVLGLQRPGNPVDLQDHPYEYVMSFDEIAVTKPGLAA